MAWVLNGIDLTKRQVGEIFVLPSEEARLLIAEGWAEPVDERPNCEQQSVLSP